MKFAASARRPRRGDIRMYVRSVRAEAREEENIMLKMAGVALGVLSGSACAQILLFTAQITGDQEVPAPVATEASGFMTGVLDRGANSFSFSWEITGPLNGDPSAPGAHIHTGFAGQSGSIIFPFDTDAWELTGSATWMNMTEDQEERLIAGGYYINFHTSAHPSGEIRGQILLVPAPGAAGLLAAGGLLAARRRR